MTTRQDKVSSLVHRLVSDYLITERPEGVTGLLTITKVEVTADLEHGKIYFSSVGQAEEEVLRILQQHRYDIQGMLNRMLQMKKVPRIKFVPDRSGAYADHISKLIRDANADRDPR